MPLEQIPAPTNGLDFDSSPTMLGRDYARTIENLLVHKKGMVRVRHGMTSMVQVWTNRISNQANSVWVHGSNCLFTRRDVVAGTAEGKYVTSGGSTTLVPIATEDHCGDGTQSPRVLDHAYKPGRQGVLRWDGTATSPVILANSPHDAAAVASYLGRLFVGGGSVPGTTTPDKENVLYWSDIGGPDGPDAVSEWSDDASGLVNQIVIGSSDDAIRALAPLPKLLVVFKRYSIWVLQGSTPASFSVKQVTDSFGLAENCVPLVMDNVVLFVSGAFSNNDREALMVYDGVTFRQFGRRPPRLGPAHFTPLGNNYVMATSWSTLAQYKQYLLHFPTESWLAFTSDALDPIEFFVSTFTDGHGSAYLTDFVSRWKLDPVTGDRNSLVLYERKHDNTAWVPVKARWLSRLVRLGLPTERVKLRRIMVDHETITTVGSPPNWTMELKNGRGEVIVPGFSVPGRLVTPASYIDELDPFYQRLAVESFEEADELYFDIEFVNTNTSSAIRGDLHDVWIEYDHTHHPGTTTS